MASKKSMRNGHACHPIMRKGGVHEKTNKAKRKAAKQQTYRKVNEWFSRSDFNRTKLVVALRTTTQHLVSA